MTKSILKTSLLAILVAAALIMLNSIYIRTQGYKNMIKVQETARLYHVPGDLEIVNFGSSHGECAFDFEEVEMKGFNFALSGQDFYYDYQLARHFKNKFTHGCVVLIPVSYFSLGVDSQGWPGCNSRYYGILPFDPIRNHNVLDYIKSRWCPILFSGEYLKWLVRDEAPLADVATHPPENNSPDDLLRAEGRHRADMHKSWKNEPESIYDFNRENLGKLISFCRREGWKPVLITTPFPDYYSVNFSQTFKKSFHEEVEKVSEEYDIPYLDYSNDATFYKDTSLFGDVEHLSEKGSRLFTRMVISRLKSMGLLPED